MADERQRGPGRKRPYHHGDLRSSLVAAVIDIGRDQGVAAVSIRSVAQAVGVSESAPYHHFSGKADLVGAAVAQAFDGLADAVDSALQHAARAGTDPALALAAAYVEYGLGHPGEYRLMFGEHVATLGLGEHEQAHAAGARVALLSLEGVDASRRRRGIDASLDEVFPPCWAVLHGLVTLVRDRELGDVALDRAVAMAVAGIDAMLHGWSDRTT